MKIYNKMLLTDKQTDQYIEWFKENYWQYCPIDEEWRLWIPIIYCENPEEEEKKHKDIWLEEIRKLMWSNADKQYIHRWGRKDTYAWVQLESLWLYHGPTFKHISEKENATK